MATNALVPTPPSAAPSNADYLDWLSQRINAANLPSGFSGLNLQPGAPSQGASDPTMDLLNSSNIQAAPPPANNAQNAGPVKAGLRHALMGMLTRASYGAGQAMTHAAGLPTDREIAMQNVEMANRMANTNYLNQETQNQALQAQLTAHRLQAMQQLGQGWNPFEGMQLNPDEQALADGAMQQFRMTGDTQIPFEALKQIQNQRAIWGRTTRGDTTITPELAKQYNIPADFIGKPISSSQIGQLQRGLAFSTVYANTANGPVIFQKTGPNPGQATAVTLNGKNIPSNQEAGAYWQAKYGVVKGVDPDTGAPTFMRRLDAPGSAAADNTYQIFKGKAGLDNYKDALTRIQSNLDVMDDPGQRALIARTMRSVGTIHDPGIIAATIGNAVSQGLSPQAADLTAAMLQAREFIGANRQFAGNFTGSEALYQRMVGNVPGPMNSAALNRSLINQDLANTARIEQRMNAFQGGAGSPKRNSAPPNRGGNSPANNPPAGAWQPPSWAVRR